MNLPSAGQHNAHFKTYLKKAWYLCINTLTLAFRRYDDTNVFPFVHVMLLFFRNLEWTECITEDFLRRVPWNEVIDFLNKLSQSEGLST